METELFLPWVDAPRVYVSAWTLCSFHSLISTPNLSEGANSVGGQLRGDKECPYSGVTKPILSMAGAAYKHVFAVTKHVLTKGFVVTSILLSRQKMFCGTNTVLVAALANDNKLTFVATNTCLSRQKYACRHKTLSCLLRETFCRDKHSFVAASIRLS